MNLEADAGTFDKQEVDYLEVVSDLPPDDIKKIYFLCLDLIPSNASCPSNAKDLFSIISEDVNVTELLKELLYHVKHYKLLRKLSTCRHKMNIALNSNLKVDSARLLLFNLCEDLENAEIKKLKKLLLKEDHYISPGWENLAAEDFFISWLRKIDDLKMKCLMQALLQMNYDVSTFEEKYRHYVSKPYEVITPEPGKPCGLAVIFNHEFFNKSANAALSMKRLSDRVATNKDEATLIDLWHSFGFDVVVFRDKISTDMVNIIRKLGRISYSKYCIFVCCIMTHGSRERIYASDNMSLDIRGDVVYKFDGDNVPTLQNKPKMFFIQACQNELKTENEQTQRKVNNIQSDSIQESPINTRSKCDILINQATIPLELSFRDCERGSWYINGLTYIFKNSDLKSKHVTELMNEVNSKVTENYGKYSNKGWVSQTPKSDFTVFYPLYLKKLNNHVPRKLGKNETCPRPELLSLVGDAFSMYLV